MQNRAHLTKAESKTKFFMKKLVVPIVLLLFLMCTAVPHVFATEESISLPGRLLIPAENETFGAVDEQHPLNLDHATSRSALSNSALPSSVNLSTSKYFPPIRNQQGGSCAAWATTYYQFTYEVARLNDWDAKHDDSKVFSPKYVWNYINQGGNNGVSRASCINILAKQGSVRWSEFPQNSLSYDWYQGSSEAQTTAALRQALKTRVVDKQTNWKNFAIEKTDKNNNGEETPITSNVDAHLNEMKQLLADGHVLSIDTFVTKWQVDTLSNGQTGILFGREQYTKDAQGNYKRKSNGDLDPSGHSMTIVGYDDNISYDLNGNGTIQNFEKGAFLLANSWGTNATDHNNGYIWVMYDALNNVSNVSTLNPTVVDTVNNIGPRKAFFAHYGYYYMEVSNYNPQRMAEVTIEQKYRNDITVSLSTSDYKTSSKTNQTTFLDKIGGQKSFDGGNNGYQTRTFVFDYDSLYDGNNKVYWVGVTDNNASGTSGSSATTTVKKIRWVNANGTVLKEIGTQSAFNGSTKYYYYGIPATGISLNKTSSTLYKGQTETLTATVSPTKTTDKSVIWRSSNTSVVKVSTSGVVTYVGTGTATVTATTTDGTNLSASCTYRITDDYQNTYNNAYSVALHSKTAGNINYGGDVDYFKFVPSASGTYLFYTTGSTDTKGFLYNAAQTQLATNDNANISGSNFALKYTLTAGQTYYIKVCANSTKTGAYTFIVCKAFYETGWGSNNQDARRVQMHADVASILDTLQIKIGSNTYTLRKPTSGTLDTTINGVRFKVTFLSQNSSLSTRWNINIDMSSIATTYTSKTVSFTFSKGTITNVNGTSLTGLVAYKSSIKTGVDSRATNSLQKLLSSMASTGYTLTVRNWDNTLVDPTATTKAATGMKIIKTNSSGKIVEIYYVVLFGDATGSGTVNIGNGIIDPADALVALQDSVELSKLGALARIAADVNHDGSIDANDALMINQHSVQLITIDQSYVVTTVPDDCYFLDPVAF